MNVGSPQLPIPLKVKYLRQTSYFTFLFCDGVRQENCVCLLI